MWLHGNKKQLIIYPNYEIRYLLHAWNLAIVK